MDGGAPVDGIGSVAEPADGSRAGGDHLAGHLEDEEESFAVR
jgi:hypothetical protein